MRNKGLDSHLLATVEPATKIAELGLRDLGSVKDSPRGGAELSLSVGVKGLHLEVKQEEETRN